MLILESFLNQFLQLNPNKLENQDDFTEEKSMEYPDN